MKCLKNKNLKINEETIKWFTKFEKEKNRTFINEIIIIYLKNSVDGLTAE